MINISEIHKAKKQLLIEKDNILNTLKSINNKISKVEDDRINYIIDNKLFISSFIGYADCDFKSVTVIYDDRTYNNWIFNSETIEIKDGKIYISDDCSYIDFDDKLLSYVHNSFLNDKLIKKVIGFTDLVINK